MNILLVTSWGDTPCGIADHSRSLQAAVQAADPRICVRASAEALDPQHDEVRSLFHDMDGSGVDLIHLNHHDGLHSRWTPEQVKRFTDAGMPVLVTYHDTTADPSPTSKLAQLAQVASSVVIHEPLQADSPIRAIYWRQGVPAAARAPADYGGRSTFFLGDAWQDGERQVHQLNWKAYPQQPVLGTVGFNFPWKNFDRLAQVTGEAGWALVILSNDATAADEERWRASNSSILVVRKFLPQDIVVNYLAGCDATAFMYECANTGTSGAIRLGIAARKPVLALATCRQFRDLAHDTLGSYAISWLKDWSDLRIDLQRCRPARYAPAVCALAHQDSWTQLGANYAQLYRMLVPA